MKKMLRYLQELVNISSKITMGILIVTAIYIEVFWGKDCEIGVKLLWEILLASFLTAIGSVFFLIEVPDHMTKKQIRIRHLADFLYVNIVIFVCGINFSWFDFHNIVMLIGMEICIIACYLFITGLCFLLDYRDAEEINQLLQQRENKE